MNEEELKLLKKIEELPKELNIEIRGLILAEVCLRIENQQLKQQLKQRDNIINKAREYVDKFIPIDEDTILMRIRQKDYLLEILNYKGEQI